MLANATDLFWRECRQQRFLIVGCTERTGYSVAALFRKHGVACLISDLKLKPEVRRKLLELGYDDTSIFEGKQPKTQLDGVDALVLSPGVSRRCELVVAAQEKGLRVWLDVDLFFPLYENKRIVGVTGTDGKTTVVHLLENFLGREYNAVACGNNGVPVATLVDRLDEIEVLVFELSSYMLEGLSEVEFDLAAVTNLSPDHEDRYDSFETYAKTKLNLLSRLRSRGGKKGLFLRNMDDAILAGPTTEVVLKKVSEKVEARTLSVRALKNFSWVGGFLVLDGLPLGDGLKPTLRGEHNKTNLLMAASLAFLVGLHKKTLLKAVEAAEGLEHRMEEVAASKGFLVVNDSKATTQQAVLSALKSFDGERHVVLVAGGRAKSSDPGLEQKTFARGLANQKNLKVVCCYGEVGQQLREAIEAQAQSQSNGQLACHYEPVFADCIKKAWLQTKANNVLLLSPGFASQDQFESYEERGRAFKRLVLGGFSAKENPSQSVGGSMPGTR